MAEISQMVATLAGQEAHSILDGGEWDLFPRPSHAGGLEGKTTLLTTDLIDIAELLAIAGEHEEAREILRRARDHQKVLFAHFEQAVAEPRRADSQRFFKGLGLESGHGIKNIGRERDRRHDEEMRRLEKITLALAATDTEIEAVIADCGRVAEPGSIVSQVTMNWSPLTRTRLEDRAVSNRARELLCEGGDSVRRARDLLILRCLDRGFEGQAQRLRSWSSGEWEWAARISRSPSESYFTRLEDLIVQDGRFGSRDGRLPSEIAEAMLRVRRSGPDQRETDVYGSRERIPVCLDTDEVKERWRGLVRDIAYHAGEVGPLPPGPLKARAVLVAEKEVLDELRAEDGEPVVLAMNGSDLHEARQCSRSVEVKGSPLRTRLYVGVRLITQEGEDEIELMAAYPLEVESDGRSSARLLKEARESDRWPASLPKDEVTESVEWGGSTASVDAAPQRASGLRPMKEVLGHSRCAHIGAEWAADAIASGEGVSDTAVLRCPRCLRRRLAAEPVHRLPDGHPLLEAARAKEEDYLRAERSYTALSGGDPGEVRSIDQLRARDGIADLSPRRFMVDEAAAAASPRSATPRSVRALMSRR